jgi:hypothetical protein
MAGREGLLRASERVYRVLLLVYPREFREAYGSHMVQVFRDLCRDGISRSGYAGLFAVWLRAFWDLVRTALVQRTRLEGGGYVLPFASSPKMVRWGGRAAITGGLLGLAAGVLNDIGLVYPKEPILNALEGYESGSSPYSPVLLLFYPIFGELLNTITALLVTVGSLGLYALVSRRSGSTALWGGVLTCLAVASFGLYACSNFYRLLVAFSGDLGRVHTDPLVNLVTLGAVVGIIGYLLLSVVVLETWALGPWSVLPLVLLPLDLVLCFLLFSLGFPAGYPIEALESGVGMLLLVESPQILTHLGNVLLGYLLLRAYVREAEAPIGARLRPSA